MDSHKCGDCQKEFDSYENFLIHKLLVEKYTLTLETSVRIPTLRLPKFIKINQSAKHNPRKEDGSVNSPLLTSPPENNHVKKPTVDSVGSPKSQCSPTIEPTYSATEVVVGEENLEDDVSDDDISVGSQAESLRIDEGAALKETPSPESDPPPEQENDQMNQYCCKHCKRCYKSKVVLRVHEETVHSSTRPYVCTTCSQGFKTKGSLVRHVRTHTGERPFSCGQCKRAFLDSGTLARHIHRVHRKLSFKQASDVKVLITQIDPEPKNIKTGNAEIS